MTSCLGNHTTKCCNLMNVADFTRVSSVCCMFPNTLILSVTESIKAICGAVSLESGRHGGSEPTSDIIRPRPSVNYRAEIKPGEDRNNKTE